MNILQMSISAGLLIVVVVTVRAIALNKLPKTLFLLLWGVVVCRLLVPYSIPSQYSAATLATQIFRQDAQQATVLPISQLPTNTFISMVADDVNLNEATEPVVQEPVGKERTQAIIWLLGMAASATFLVIVHFRSRRELSCALPYENEQRLERWLSMHQLSRPMRILYSDRIKTPLTIGLLKPRIILPKTIDLNDRKLMSYVLTHEYYHIKRWDALWKLLMAIALCVHWFNPLVWVMFVLINRDLELTCDEMVVRHFGATTKKDYAYSLIGMAEQRGKFAPLYNSFSKNAVEERITAIMKTRKYSMLSIIIACTLMLCITTVFATSEISIKTETTADEQTETTINMVSDTSTAPLSSISDVGGVTTPNSLAIDYSEYLYFGLVVEDGKLFYQEKPVRIFEDIYTFEGNVFSRNYYFDENGAIDVYTVRDENERVEFPDGTVDPAGALTGLAFLNGEAFAQRDISIATAAMGNLPIVATTALSSLAYESEQNPVALSSTAIVSASANDTTIIGSNADGKTFAEMLAPYKDLGISVTEVTGSGGVNIFYQDKLIKTFVDERIDGSVLSFSSVDGGEGNVRTIYSADGRLTGLAVYDQDGNVTNLYAEPSTMDDAPAPGSTSNSLAASYDLVMPLRSSGYQSLTVKEFNTSVKAAIDSGTGFLDAYQALGVSLQVEDSDYPFVMETLNHSVAEIVAPFLGDVTSISSHLTNYSDEYTDEDDAVFYKFMFTALCSVEYRVIDESAITVGERDELLRTYMAELQGAISQMEDFELVEGNCRDRLEGIANDLAKTLSSEALIFENATIASIEIVDDGHTYTK